MKKNKVVLIIIILILFTIFLFGDDISRIFFAKNYYTDYLSHLSNKYNKEFIILDKIENPKNLNEDYIEAYNCVLKENTDIKFIIGYGKFYEADWSVFKTRKNFETYRESIEKYLQNKYLTTITIDDRNTINDAVENIKNIIEQYQNDYVYYGISKEKPQYFDLILNINYYNNLIENIKFYNSDTIRNVIETETEKYNKNLFIVNELQK